MAPSDISAATYIFKVRTPSLNPPSATGSSSQNVVVTVDTSGAVIHYTTNGLEPTESDAVVASGGTVVVGGTLKAKAFRDGWNPSDTVTGTYAFQVASPSFNPPEGALTGETYVQITSSTAGAAIRYTEDNTEPTSFSTLYTEPVLVTSSRTLRAKAYRNGWLPSATASTTYTMDPNALLAPTFDPGGGTYATSRNVAVSTPTPGATIHFTTDGTDPTEASPQVPSGSTILVDHSMTLKARAWKGPSASLVARADYAITGAIAVGGRHTLALKADGTVWAWGSNAQGQLGDGSNVDSAVPVLVGGLTGVVAIRAGAAHSLALKADGALWAWGDNGSGQLGDGTAVALQTTPVQVPLTNVADMAAGTTHSLALTADGQVWAWGENGDGQLGVPSAGAMSPEPVLVGGVAGIVSVTAGRAHSLALANDGTVWAWGNNDLGELGNGGFQDQPTPVHLTSIAAVTRLAAGDGFSLALKSNGDAAGELWGWGRHGYGTSAGVPTPTAVLPDVVEIAAGASHGLVVRRDASVWGWGANDVGQLGDGSTVSRSAAIAIPGAPLAVAVAAGGKRSAALALDAVVWTWGDGVTSAAPTAGLVLAANTDANEDPDGDGLPTAVERLIGTDPFNPDTNGDGIPDGAELALGLSPTHPDMDMDGIPNAVELSNGTDPFSADTDGDGVPDGEDAFPLDPTQSEFPPPDPNDVTPPTITLIEPADAVLVSTVP
jgi:alpha-tubulin suppressor-like RCC1 family protein